MPSNQEVARREAERKLKEAKAVGADKRDIAKLEAAYNAAKSEVKGGSWGMLS